MVYQVDLARFDQRRHRARLPEAGPLNAVVQVDRGTVWVHIHQLGSPVGVGRRGTRVKNDVDRTGHLKVSSQWRCGVHQHIRSLLHGLLVVGTLGAVQCPAAGMTAHAGHRIARVVIVGIRPLLSPRHSRDQLPISHRRCGVPSAGQVVLRPLGTRQRPGRSGFPDICSHLEVVDRRAITHTVVDTLEKMIPPGQHQLIDGTVADRSDLLEYRCRGTAGPTPADMVPGPDYDPLVVSREN